MLRLIQLLILGHIHKWKIIAQGPFREWDGEVGKSALRRECISYTLQCEHCGNIKERRA